MLGFLQRIGKSLMLPIATLPAASLLLRFGNIDYESDLRLGASVGGWLNHYAAPFLNAGGAAIFDNLPLLFAVGIAIGLAGDAVAALAAVIAYQVLAKGLEAVPVAFDVLPPGERLDMGVLGGIVAGLVSATLYKRYHRIKLPAWLGFFSGKRFVPIAASFAMVVVALLCGLIWVPVQQGLDAFSHWFISLGGVGAFLYGFANRMLIPFGLHHILNSIAWFQIGEFTDANGKVVYGDLNRFFAGDPTAGTYMTGFYPIMMFALPGAALAFIHSASPRKRKAVASVFVSAAFVSFLTGITEPIEFAFMFAAPVLYLLHAVLTGASGWLMAELGVKIGSGFSQGLIDYAINFSIGTKPLLVLPVGLGFGALYYLLFRAAIARWKLRTPGREAENEEGTALAAEDIQAKAAAVLRAIGGAANVEALDACITRLRLFLRDDRTIDEKALKSLGAVGVVRLGHGAVQIVFGVQSELLKDEMSKIM